MILVPLFQTYPIRTLYIKVKVLGLAVFLVQVQNLNRLGQSSRP